MKNYNFTDEEINTVIKNLGRIELHICDRENHTNLPPVAMGWCSEAIQVIQYLQEPEDFKDDEL